jgi:3-deoxy-manno-octulosonate cytidylyltransferase (CMP-KDO synthetase)
MQHFTVVIPARYASERLPGKPLAMIGGRPMILWVHERALQSGAREVIVATDDSRIADACGAAGAVVEMTSAQHASGTDRIAEVAARRRWSDREIVVNVQGDEPLIPPTLITQTARVLAARDAADMATLVTPIANREEFEDHSTAKVVVDRAGFALYFSRAAIPSPRDASNAVPVAWRHIGIYAYRVAALRALTAAAPCAVEQIERLEQLRALWLGQKIAVETACVAAPRAVDTAADLAAVRAIVGDRLIETTLGR